MYAQTTINRDNLLLVFWNIIRINEDNEFWKTLTTLKSETIWLYINEKKDTKIHNSKPFTAILLNCNTDLLFFLREMKNWKIAKHKDSQSEKFPTDADTN